MAILRKLRDIRTLWHGAALWMVFFAETSHCAYVKAKALLGDWRNYLAVSSLWKVHLEGFV